MDRRSVAASWLKFTGAHGRSDYQDFVEWFIRQMFNTPLDPADRGRDRLRARNRRGDADRERPREPRRASHSGRSTLVGAAYAASPTHLAPDNEVTAYADVKGVAQATDGRLLTVTDGGHNPQVRKPIAVNIALR